MINLSLAKIGDNVTANKKYKAKDKNGSLHKYKEIKFHV